MPIIRNSRVLHRWFLPVVLGALVYRLSVWCEALDYVSGLRDAATSRKPDTSRVRMDLTLLGSCHQTCKKYTNVDYTIDNS